MTIALKSKYGPRGIVTGGSDGVGAAFARAMASRGMAGGPTWICGSSNPAGGSPLGALSRRDAVLAMSRGASASALTTGSC